ncbi:outer membrane protein assembly factor BamA [Motiliproteus sp. SC1-56]|uniref:outer membrane protein assembly factor BamA n=1 Tax=Motiliproteus sp. SC1-56 TaxID=2799565 RepID=UPI001A9076FA|nr:outer membrane protein assembly factor BamA [Motiliproteus sp. SC1-56]
MRRRLALLWILLLLPLAALADSFKVNDIRIDGLQRIDLGTVFAAFPVDVGETVDEFRLSKAARALFATGYFNDIRLARDGNVLIVKVQERPALSKIEIEGNDVIETDKLLDGLKNLGLAEGEVFQRATLERIRLELLRLYAGQGRYGAQVDAEIESLPENRVGLTIRIREGEPAAIQHINIVGNTAFDDETLAGLFTLKTPSFWSFFGDDSKYSREKLSGDLERLRSYYLDRGYINFAIDSTQVSLTPDRKHVYITINVSEGERFRFAGFELAGDLVLPREELQSQVELESGAIFSRRAMVASATQLTRRLGNEGYLQANVNPVPDVDEAQRTVAITFFINPGRRIYVRRINFRGNTNSADEVLRREMRQMEAAWASTELMETSKRRLERLGYFASVNLETSAVPGTEDQIDLEYSVEEQLSGHLSASIGFSQESGLLLGANVSQKNFLGTGKQVSVAVNNSRTDTEYSFSFTDPYHTVDGVSRGFDLYYRKQDFEEGDTSDYSTDTYGGGMSFGYPIDEHQRLRFGWGLSHLSVSLGNDIPQEISDFVDAEGDEYNQLNLTASWSDNHLNKGLMATDGYSQSLSLELGAPGSDLNFWKLRYRGQRYFPLTGDWVLSLRTELGYADSMGNTSELPFFEHFYAGGFNSVRGFKSNSLGPRANNLGRDPLGGNALVEGSMELIFPFPFVEDPGGLRSLLYLDVGSVFDTSCLSSNPNCDSGIALDEMSASVGVGVSWLTFVGPLSFSYAVPVIEQDDDETEAFQFALGRSF